MAISRSGYMPVEGKSLQELEIELRKVWYSHYEPTSAAHEGYDGPNYEQMITLFAEDNFYNLHLVAKQFIFLRNIKN